MIIRSLSGIRGEVAKDMDAREVYRTCAAYYDLYLKEKIQNNTLSLVVGKDAKASGNKLMQGVFAWVKNMKLQGIQVAITYLGVSATPMVSWAVKTLRKDGGIMITASHNPIEWNGVKLFNSANDSVPGGQLHEPRMKIIADYLNAHAIQTATVREFEVPQVDVATINRYGNDTREKIIELINFVSGKNTLGQELFGKITSSSFKIALDACSHEGALVVRGVLNAFGIENNRIIVVNDKSIEESERILEPRPEYLTKLSETIEKEKCLIGFAVDPDQDRLVSMPLRSEDQGMLLCGKFLMELQEMNSKKVITGIPVNLSTSAAWDDVAGTHRIPIIRTLIGEPNVAAGIAQGNYLFGCEGNGGFIVPSVNWGRNSAVGIGLMLSYLTMSKKTLSELEADLPPYEMHKYKIELTDALREKRKEAIEKLRAYFEKQESTREMDFRDGIKVVFNDWSWIHVRYSNTEPIVRIFIEVKSSEKRGDAKKVAEELFRTVREILGSMS